MNSLLTLCIAIGIWLLFCIYRIDSKFQIAKFDRNATMPLRGFMAMAVVIGHLFIRTDCNFYGIGDYFKWHTFAVAVFFFISGYGMFSQWLNRKDYLDGNLIKVSRKILLPMFILIGIIAGYSILTHTFSFSSVVKDYSEGQTAMLPHSWYVWELFLFSLIFNIFGLIIKDLKSNNKSLIMLLLLFAGSIKVYITLRYVFHWPKWWWFSTISFPIGVLYAYKEDFVKNLIAKYGRYFYIALFAITLSIFALNMFFDSEASSLLLQAVLGPIVAMCVYVVKFPSGFGIWNFLGGISYEIYLVHGIVRNTIDRHVSLPYCNAKGGGL